VRGRGPGVAHRAARDRVGGRARRADRDPHRHLRRYQLLAANNELLGDLTQYQVSESLARFGLPRVVDGLVTWAFPDAQQVQTDVAHVLGASGAARVAATAKAPAVTCGRSTPSART
jgi:hypothetical protein